MVLRHLYCDGEINTVRDLLRTSWVFLIPVFNISFLLIYHIGMFFSEGSGYKVIRFWDGIMNIGLKR